MFIIFEHICSTLIGLNFLRESWKNIIGSTSISNENVSAKKVDVVNFLHRLHDNVYVVKLSWVWCMYSDTWEFLFPLPSLIPEHRRKLWVLLEALTSSISESEQPHHHALQNTLHSGSGQVEVFCLPVYHRKCDFSCPLSLFKYFYSWPLQRLIWGASLLERRGTRRITDALYTSEVVSIEHWFVGQ